MAESGTLLRCYTRKGIEGSNPSLSAKIKEGCPFRQPFLILMWEADEPFDTILMFLVPRKSGSLRDR